MAKALGIITTSGNRIHVEGLQAHRPVSSFSFVGRYRVIDFPVSNLSNSDIERIMVYVDADQNPRSLAEHLGTGRHYNINSKRGKLQLVFCGAAAVNQIYKTDIAGFLENFDLIERAAQEYVVIAPSTMVYAQDYGKLLDSHIASGADVTLLYHRVSNAKEAFLNCDTLKLNRQRGVEAITRNLGNVKDKNIFAESYVMKKELFITLIKEAKKISSTYTLAEIVSDKCKELDVRAAAHEGYFAAITDLKSYYDANLDLTDLEVAKDLFRPSWPIYTKTTDACPTKVSEKGSIKNSLVSNGCQIDGTVENCVVGRSCTIKAGAVVKNCVVLAYTTIGKDVHVEGQVVDKWVTIKNTKEIVADPSKPGYINRDDTL
ncbi:MAG: glucose-1-phosphate adenylyltransferase subunit GlgD [Lachnospiraceae bacterium]|nr:glucose-1-phosphate adenylyltransferase subunit GlgD [Lachnospiraceae bacterium]